MLDCWARMDEMAEIAGLLDDIAPGSRERLDRAMATIAAGTEGEMGELLATRDALLALA